MTKHHRSERANEESEELSPKRNKSGEHFGGPKSSSGSFPKPDGNIDEDVDFMSVNSILRELEMIRRLRRGSTLYKLSQEEDLNNSLTENCRVGYKSTHTLTFNLSQPQSFQFTTMSETNPP